MDVIHPSDYPHALTILPCYPHEFWDDSISYMIACKLTVCIISSLCLSYIFYRKFHINRHKSWKTVMEIMGPVEKRLQNLEKERLIYNSYIEWIEDYCAVYYGLLNYLNSTITDLDKLYKDHSKTLKTASDLSVTLSEICSNKAGDNQFDWRGDAPFEGLGVDDSAQLAAHFANTLKLHEIRRCGSGDERRGGDSFSTISMGFTSTAGTNDDSGRDDLESLTQGSDEESKLVEKLKMFFTDKGNMSGKLHPEAALSVDEC